ncbi:MAG: ATP-binding protein [Anaerolineae bacterium]
MRKRFSQLLLAVPVRLKVGGIMLLPVLILGFSLNYWVRAGLSDWLSWLLESNRVRVAMEAGGRSVLLVTALAAVLSLALTYEMMVLLTQPLLELREVAHRVAEGELGARARLWAKDEIGEVGAAVNLMLDRLQESQQALRRINRRLYASSQVAAAVARGLDLGQVLDAALATTLRVMDLKRGWVYLYDPTRDRFILATALAPPHNVEEMPQSPCRCQRMLLQQGCHVGASLTACERLQASSGGRIGNHISIPLGTRDECFGVMNLVWAHDSEPGSEEFEILNTIAAQVSEAVANAWLHARLREKETALQALLSAHVTAQEDERARIARELHDGTGQALTSLLLRLKALEAGAQSVAARRNLKELCKEMSSAIELVRDLSHRLHPPALDDLGLESALRALLEDMAGESGLCIRFDSNLGPRRLPRDVETTLYRITQEALTNVHRHAQARHMSLLLRVQPRALELAIEDDGVGFSIEAVEADGRRHLGLASIYERAEMMGGRAEVHTAPGAGTRIEVRIPLPQEAAA